MSTVLNQSRRSVDLSSPAPEEVDYQRFSFTRGRVFTAQQSGDFCSVPHSPVGTEAARPINKRGSMTSMASSLGSSSTSQSPRRAERKASLQPAHPSIEMSLFPDYGRMHLELFHNVCSGWAAVGRELFTMHWMYFVMFPVGIYYLFTVWVSGFVHNPPVVERTDTAPWLTRYTKPVNFTNDSTTAKKGVWMMPQFDKPTFTARGLSQRGLTSFEMMRLILLFFPQLMVGSFWRCLQFKFGFGRFKERKGDNHQTYLAIANTSLAHYYDLEEDAFVYHNIRLLANFNVGQIFYSSIKIYCDHDEGEVTHVVMTTAVDDHHNPVEEVVVVTDADEMAMVITQVGALGTHPQVHWRANGVSEIEQWNLHKISCRWSNFLNMMSIHQSLFFYHGTFNQDTEILGNNALGGMPAAPIPDFVQYWSVSSHMIAEARATVKAHFKRIRKPLKEEELDCLMAATITHSADHHYLDKHSAVIGLCQVLKSDFRALRVGIVAGYRWIGTKFLCKQYLDDPVCRILYDVALKHDPEFADGILTMGIAI